MFSESSCLHLLVGPSDILWVSRISLKMYFVTHTWDIFPDNLGAISYEHGKKFHQDIIIMKNRYQGCFNPNTIGDTVGVFKVKQLLTIIIGANTLLKNNVLPNITGLKLYIVRHRRARFLAQLPEIILQ